MSERLGTQGQPRVLNRGQLSQYPPATTSQASTSSRSGHHASFLSHPYGIVISVSQQHKQGRQPKRCEALRLSSEFTCVSLSGFAVAQHMCTCLRQFLGFGRHSSVACSQNTGCKASDSRPCSKCIGQCILMNPAMPLPHH